MTKFRCRVISQNKGIYIVMAIGILFSSILMLFGTMLKPLLNNYVDEVKKSELAPYQYVLKTPMKIDNKNAEKYSMSVLENSRQEDITLFGISTDSKALNLEKMPDFGKGNKAYVSDGYMEKYHLREGDSIVLREKYGDGMYTFEVAGKYVYPTALSVFVSNEQYNRILDKDRGYFTGYLSNKKLEEIPEASIETVITEKDLMALSDQLKDSMGMFLNMFAIFVFVLFIIVIYLLSKIVTEKNSRSISILKILGYSNKEARSIYNRATGAVVAISLVVSIPLSRKLIKYLYYAMMQNFPGWLSYYLPHKLDLLVVGTGMVCYILVYIIESRRIANISLSESLKDME